MPPTNFSGASAARKRSVRSCRACPSRCTCSSAASTSATSSTWPPSRWSTRRKKDRQMEMESKIRANAELLRTVARENLGVDAEYDEAGVRWLDQYINGQREAATPEVKERLPNTLGAYLGECIRLTHGGDWI